MLVPTGKNDSMTDRTKPYAPRSSILGHKNFIGHKDKYIDTSRKISTQEMLMSNMKALILTI